MKDIKNIKIAVVIATYNGENFIREQLESILSQTLMPYEVIISDDNSKDSTWDILKEYKLKFPALFRIYRNKLSLGPHENFINAFQYVTADYIAPCDQDDIWLPEKLEHSYYMMCEKNCSLVACKEFIKYEDGKEVDNFYPIPSLEDCILNHCVAGHLIFVPRNSIEVFNITNKISYDLGLLIYAGCNNGGELIDYHGCIWRRHENVVTSAYSNHNPYNIEKKSKWQKLFITIRLTICSKKSNVIYRRQISIHQIISHYSKKKKGLRIYDRLSLCMMKQTPLSLFFAGLLLGEIKSKTEKYRSYPIKNKIANRLFNLCRPAVFWYDYHLRDAL